MMIVSLSMPTDLPNAFASPTPRSDASTDRCVHVDPSRVKTYTKLAPSEATTTVSPEMSTALPNVPSTSGSEALNFVTCDHFFASDSSTWKTYAAPCCSAPSAPTISV